MIMEIKWLQSSVFSHAVFILNFDRVAEISLEAVLRGSALFVTQNEAVFDPLEDQPFFCQAA